MSLQEDTDMNITKEQFDRAFTEFQLFGPRRRTPIEKRWRKILPDVDPAQFAEIKAQCKEIETFALSLAEQVRNKQISNEIALKQFAKQYPVLTGDRLGHTWSQAIYFSLK
jgi:hypothetical protein